jgi:hypothetical protein
MNQLEPMDADLTWKPFYRMKIWYQGGRSIKIVEKSSTNQAAWVRDTVTGRDFLMSLIDRFPHTRKNNLVQFDRRDWN